MYYIGVDLGTSSVKLLLMDSQGAIKNIVSEDRLVRAEAGGLVDADEGRCQGARFGS